MEKLTFDRAINEMKALIGKTWKLVIVPYILMAIYSVYTTNFTDIYKGFDNPNAISAMGIDTMMRKLGFMYLNVGIVLLMTGFILVFVLNAYRNAHESKSLEVIDLLIQSLKNLPRLIGGYLIIALCFLASIFILTILSVFAMMWLVPVGILLILVEVFALIFMYYLFSMSIYILILEKGTFVLKRCLDIFKKSKGLLGIYFGISIGVSIAVTLFSMPAQTIQITSVKIIFSLISSLISVIVGPLLTALGFVIYNEMIRKEQDSQVETETSVNDVIVNY